MAILFGMLLAAAAGPPAYDPEFDPGALKTVAGRPNEVLVLGTPHLSGMPETFDPANLGPLLARLASWKPDIITIEAVERSRPEFLRGVASGDVVGEGSWRLRPLDPAVDASGNVWTEVEFNWDVRANRRWMEVRAPVARPIFVSSHDHVMERGAKGLAEHLGCDLRGFSAQAA